jgi:ADP-ribosylglycohydrolase
MRQRSWASLVGTAVGDAYGERVHRQRRNRPVEDPWRWTDDTEMACSVFHVLDTHGRVDADALAASFFAHYDIRRGYGAGVDGMMRWVEEGENLRDLAARAFDGTGSWGNGAAMRVPPLGAWFTGDPARAAAEADVSARVTHTHPEGVAGTIAIAVAAAVEPGLMFDEVLRHTPPGQVRDGVEQAATMPDASPAEAAETLGNGSRQGAPDTVPLALWAVARHPNDYGTAVTTAATVAHDVDTVCAIVGGVLAGRLGADAIPPAWLAATEPLPSWV